MSELNRLYEFGAIKAKPYMSVHSYVRHLESYGHLYVDRKIITSNLSFVQYYESELQESYLKYKSFLENLDLLDPYWNFKEEDILTLMIIESNKVSIVESEQTKNQISSFYFRHEDAKYLRNSISLSNAILKILGIQKYPGDEKDQQYIICVPTKRPKSILLCENIDKLRLPDKFRDSDIELWYAGGRNIAKLRTIRESESLPFLYVCDWDHDGLLIYLAIKRDYIPRIKLVIPKDWEKVKKPIGSHKSVWRHQGDYDFSGFSQLELEIISELIATNSWIEEESFSFNLNFE